MKDLFYRLILGSRLPRVDQVIEGEWKITIFRSKARNWKMRVATKVLAWAGVRIESWKLGPTKDILL